MHSISKKVTELDLLPPEAIEDQSGNNILISIAVSMPKVSNN